MPTKFVDHYYTEEVLDEDIFTGAVTAIQGKLGTALANVFRKRKKVNVPLDFLKVLNPLTRNKYQTEMDNLMNMYNNKSKIKGLFINEIREGSLSTGVTQTGEDSTRGKATVGEKIKGTGPVIATITQKIPKTSDDKELWSSKIHAPDISVYMFNNGGRISLFNLPMEGTDSKDKFDPNKRTYGVGMNGAAMNAFEKIHGVSYKNWLVMTSTPEEEAKEKEDKNALDNVDISKDLFIKLVPESKSISFIDYFSEESQEEKQKAELERQEKNKPGFKPIQPNEFEKVKDKNTGTLIKSLTQIGASKPEKISMENQENMEKGYQYKFKKGNLFVYKLKGEEKYKLAYSPTLKDDLLKIGILSPVPKLK